MLGHGGPTCLDEVRPYVENVVKGRNVPQERIEAVIEQYKLIGGKSPFNELTREQGRLLEAKLKSEQVPVIIQLGTLFWNPSVTDAINKLADRKVRRAVALIMAPHRTEASFERYIRSVQAALVKSSVVDLRVAYVPVWHNHPLFISALKGRLHDAVSGLSPDKRLQAKLIFTAHSIPVEMSGSQQYVEQIRQTASLVAQDSGFTNWEVAFQSRSGDPLQPWLEPDVRDVITQSAQSGCKQLVVMPIGFVCDHVEVLFDLDVQAKAVAAAQAVEMIRVPTVGNHPHFIEMMSELVKAELTATTATAAGTLALKV